MIFESHRLSRSLRAQQVSTYQSPDCFELLVNTVTAFCDCAWLTQIVLTVERRVRWPSWSWGSSSCLQSRAGAAGL